MAKLSSVSGFSSAAAEWDAPGLRPGCTPLHAFFHPPPKLQEGRPPAKGSFRRRTGPHWVESGTATLIDATVGNGEKAEALPPSV